MTNSILNEDIVKNYRKPVYIAGDMNAEPEDDAITDFTNEDFEVLNDTENPYHCTSTDGRYIDLILEWNKNPNHKTIDKGIPAGADRTFTISDHLPYYVKVKFK
jgi:endonuclease/exonuclease/phosphatase family metal-dependent hydrolase